MAIITPEDRLKTQDPLANQRALDAQRRAVNTERHAMASERALQRGFRRAVRRGDMRAIATLSGTMKELNVNPLSGGGITDSMQQQQIAVERAKGRANIGSQIFNQINPGNQEAVNDVDRGVSNIRQSERNRPVDGFGRSAAPSATTSAQTPSGAAGGVANTNPALSFDEMDALARERSQASGAFGTGGPNPFYADSRQRFAKDLQDSELIKSGDKGALERANLRGAVLGVKKEEIDRFLGVEPTLPAPETKSAPAVDSDAVRLAKKIRSEFNQASNSEPSLFSPVSLGNSSPKALQTQSVMKWSGGNYDRNDETANDLAKLRATADEDYEVAVKIMESSNPWIISTQPPNIQKYAEHYKQRKELASSRKRADYIASTLSS